ncbi:MAG: heavy-metal-associated domain-containing protein [Haloplanus sp.]
MEPPHKTGYRTTVRTTKITVEGMSCEHCEETVTDALGGVDGVTDVAVGRAAERATVDGDADADSLVRAVEDAGYEASA